MAGVVLGLVLGAVAYADEVWPAPANNAHRVAKEQYRC